MNDVQQARLQEITQALGFPSVAITDLPGAYPQAVLVVCQWPGVSVVGEPMRHSFVLLPSGDRL